MEINATLFGQLLTFAVLVWFTLKYVWPPITNAMQERAKKIAAGLQAAERSQRELQQAEHRIVEMLRNARVEASNIIENANKRSTKMLEEAKEHAKQEGQKILERARDDIASEVSQTREVLRTQLAELAVAGAGKILRRHLDVSAQKDLLDEFVAEL